MAILPFSPLDSFDEFTEVQAPKRAAPPLPEPVLSTLKGIFEGFSDSIQRKGSLFTVPSDDAKEVLGDLRLILEVAERLEVGHAGILDVTSEGSVKRWSGGLKPPTSINEITDEAARQVWQELQELGYEPYIANLSNLKTRSLSTILCIRTSDETSTRRGWLLESAILTEVETERLKTAAGLLPHSMRGVFGGGNLTLNPTDRIEDVRFNLQRMLELAESLGLSQIGILDVTGHSARHPFWGHATKRGHLTHEAQELWDWLEYMRYSPYLCSFSRLPARTEQVILCVGGRHGGRL